MSFASPRLKSIDCVPFLGPIVHLPSAVAVTAAAAVFAAPLAGALLVGGVTYGLLDDKK